MAESTAQQHAASSSGSNNNGNKTHTHATIQTTTEMPGVFFFSVNYNQMTNCNGGGQCGTCVVQVVEAEGWDPRSEWEAGKLKVQPSLVVRPYVVLIRKLRTPFSPLSLHTS